MATYEVGQTVKVFMTPLDRKRNSPRRGVIKNIDTYGDLRVDLLPEKGISAEWNLKNVLVSEDDVEPVEGGK